MSIPRKLLWTEGLTLFPQHLQQQDRYHEDMLHRTAHSLNANHWGVREATWQTEALAGKLLQVATLSLVFRDGELYDAPGMDRLPEPLDLSTLPPEQSTFTIHAALPMFKPYGSNLPAPGGNDNGARYAPDEAGTPDLFSASIGVNVAYLQKRVQLISDHAPLDSYEHIPVIRLERQPDGEFIIDRTFMPPGVCIGGIAGLPALFNNLRSKLNSKSEALTGRQRQSRENVFEFHSGDMAAFWMLQTIHIANAALADLANFKEQHPRQLFDVMRTLAAGLLTFSPKYSVADFPRYNHLEPASHFGKLNAIIGDLVDTVFSTKYLVISLERDKQKASYHHGKLDAAKIDAGTLLCLAVNADMPALEVVNLVPQRLKVGSPDDVVRLVGASLSGVGLVHLAQVPADIPVRPNTHYFSLDKKKELYENMLKAQAITIYAPDGMPGLTLELIALSA